MPGSNPSADSVASTDAGGMLWRPPFAACLQKLPIGRGTKAPNPGGARRLKAPEACAGDPTFLFEGSGRPLIMHCKYCLFTLRKGSVWRHLHILSHSQ